jgi:TonB family protein
LSIGINHLLKFNKMKKSQLYKTLLFSLLLFMGMISFTEAQVEAIEGEKIFMIVENQPEPIGGMEGFYKYIAQNMVYPKEARRVGIEGRVFLQFLIRKDGSLTDIKLLKGIGHGCDEEAIRVLQNAEKWKPGTQRGRAVNVRMSIPIVFKLSQPKIKEEPLLVVDEMPEPIKGTESLYKYIGKNIQYPSEARKAGMEGRVFISFVVNEDGKLSDVKTVRSPDESLSQEAMRVFVAYPDGWKPGKKEGKVAKTKMVLPVEFKFGNSVLIEEVEEVEELGEIIAVEEVEKPSPLIIVDGIEISGESELKNIDPKDIKSIDVLKGETAIARYGEKGRNGVVLVHTKRRTNPLIIIDGVEQKSDYDLFNMENIKAETIEILKGETAISQYGEKGKYGVILIYTKKEVQAAEIETAQEYKINLYPNPSNKTVNIDLEIPQAERVQITAHNQRTGKKQVVLEQNYKAGAQSFAWEVINIEADIYILQIVIGSKITYRRVVVEK